MLLCLILYIFLKNNYILALDYFHNFLISINLDICGTLPPGINSYYIESSKSLFFEVIDKKNYKIGNVYENGILIYPDSDILIYRKVIQLVNTTFNGFVIQVNSIYINNINDSKKIGSNDDNEINDKNHIKEAIELFRHSVDSTYREIIRVPYTINLRPNSLNPPNLMIEYHENESDSNAIKVVYDIKNKDILKYMIGIVKYGDIIIDDSVYGIIYKGAAVSFSGNQGVIIEISKITKSAKLIYSKCKILFFNSKPYECEIIESYTRVLM